MLLEKMAISSVRGSRVISVGWLDFAVFGNHRSLGEAINCTLVDIGNIGDIWGVASHHSAHDPVGVGCAKGASTGPQTALTL